MKKATARHILVSSKEICEELKKEIENGADFAAIAKEMSECPSGLEGGDLGEFTPGQMVKAFDKVVFSGEVGKIYGPVKNTIWLPFNRNNKLNIRVKNIKMENVVIIGSGPAGLTAAIYCARANLKPIVILGNLPGGQLTQTTDIENFPGFPEAINGFELMIKMQQQAEKFGTKLIYDSVKTVDFKDGGPQTVHLASGDKLISKTVIIATGATPRWLGLESEERLKTKGVSACATCDGAFFRDVPVIVVGGGDSAMEEALFLTKFASKVYIIHRRDQLRASKIMGDRAKQNPKIEIVWDSVVSDILGKDEVEAVKVKNVKTEVERTIECKGYFVALGHIPSTGFLQDINKDRQGYIELKSLNSHTNIDGVFAAGDCADKTYRQAITAAGMGCKAALDIEHWLEANS